MSCTWHESAALRVSLDGRARSFSSCSSPASRSVITHPDMLFIAVTGLVVLRRTPGLVFADCRVRGALAWGLTVLALTLASSRTVETIGQPLQTP